MGDIKFGTDGWRAIIANDYTIENVIRVSEASARWLNNNFKNPSVVIGYDCRFGGEMFANVAAKVFAHNNINCLLSDKIATTPMVSYGVVNKNASLGVVITASHNPHTYNGFKLKGNFGGPLLPKNIAEVEKLIPKKSTINAQELKSEYSLIEYVNLEEMYFNQISSAFDLNKIHQSKINIAYDGMYGAGQFIMKKIFPNATFIHCENNPSFNGTPPEPIMRNLNKLSSLVKSSKSIDIGIANDGDADRIGIINKKGDFIDSHHIILLLIYYLVKHKNYSGKIITAFSVTEKAKKLCAYFNLKNEVVKIGFKHIAGHFLNEDVLLGGEESGGIAIKGHIAERDGVWVALTLLEFMSSTNKKIDELIDEIYNIVGPFAFHRVDLHINEDLKKDIMQKCKNGFYTHFGNNKIVKTETIDGYKFFLNDEEWIMIRPSGTEPVLRTYSEARSIKVAKKYLADCKNTIL